MTGELLMGWPPRAPLPPSPRPVRAVRQQPTVKGRVFAEFARALERGDRHEPRLVGVIPKTPRRPESDPRLTTGGADPK